MMRFLVRFSGFLFAAGTVVFLIGVAAAAGLIWHFSKDLPDYSQLADYEPPVTTRSCSQRSSTESTSRCASAPSRASQSPRPSPRTGVNRGEGRGTSESAVP